MQAVVIEAHGGLDQVKLPVVDFDHGDAQLLEPGPFTAVTPGAMDL